jgi:hypothetical protein
VWIDLPRSPYPRQPRGPIGPPQAANANAPAAGAAAATSRAVVNARLLRAGTIPDPKAILPYRHALVVNEYEILEVVRGEYKEKTIPVAQWAIRDGRVLPDARRIAGAAFTLTVERYDAHPELEGERLIAGGDLSKRPLFYAVP